MMINLLGWIGAVIGIVSALLLALNVPISRFGFMGYLLSNLCWIAYAALTGTRSLLLMQLAFVVTSSIGLLRWFSPPWGRTRRDSIYLGRRRARGIVGLLQRLAGPRRAPALWQWLR